MSAAQGAVLFGSPGLRATFRDAGAPHRPLVVTFDSLNADLRLERPGFGEAWLAQAGLDAVHVVSARNAWYQDPDTPALLAAVRATAVGRERVVTYGSSMGAYAAARFAGAVGAQAAIALSPQFSIDPALAPWETRWVEYAQELDLRADAADDAADGRPPVVFAFYDPVDPDRLHVEALGRRFGVVPVPVRGAGHPAGTFLAECGLLAPTVLAVVEDRFDPAAFQAARRESRRRSAAYLARLALRQPARRAALALALTREAVRLAPRTAAYRVTLADRLAATAAHAEAGEALRAAHALAPDDPVTRLRLAEHLVLDGGDPAEAGALVRGLERRGAVREWMFVRAADLLFAAGDFTGARDEAQAGLRRLPGSRALRARAWGLGALLAVPGAGRAALAALRPHLVRRRLREGGGS